MKILVTGGAGYIGAVLLEKLLKAGYRVRVFDNFLFGKTPIKPFLKKIEIVNKDIRKIAENDVKGCDAVIHLAGLSNDPMADFDPALNLQINTEGTIKLAEICKTLGIKRFTFSSSASIYNRGILKRTRIQDEGGIVKPKAAYSVSKYKAEKALLDMSDKNFSPVIFRQGTVYGYSTRMRYDLVVNAMTKTALTENKIYVFCGGVQWRPLVDVEDVAIAHIKAIELPEKKFKSQIINLFYENYKIIDVAYMVKKTVDRITGKDTRIVIDNSPKKDRSYRISNSRIEKLLKWKPSISIEESVSKIINQTKGVTKKEFSNPKYYNIQWMKKKNST